MLILALLLLLLPACGRAEQGRFGSGSNTPAGIAVEIVVEPEYRLDEAATVVVTLSEAGEPLSGATVALEGNMNHAGMAPLLVDATERAPGEYAATLDWSMGGEWLVTARATLPDGRDVSRTVEGIEVRSSP